MEGGSDLCSAADLTVNELTLWSMDAWDIKLDGGFLYYINATLFNLTGNILLIITISRF